MEGAEPSKRRVIVIGGWGCPAHWLHDFATGLLQCQGLDVHMVTLPGYHSGQDSVRSGADIHDAQNFNRQSVDRQRVDRQSFDVLLENWFQSTSELIESSPDTLLIGWSYGAMLAVAMSARLSKPCQVIGLGARPCFINDPCSVFDAETSRAFMQRMIRSPLKGLEYFIALTGQGVTRAKLQSLKHDVRDALPAEPGVLVASLEHLYRLDVTDAWQQLKKKGVLHDWYFKEDRLIASSEKSENSIEGCHLAPVSDAEQVVNALLPLIRT